MILYFSVIDYSFPLESSLFYLLYQALHMVFSILCLFIGFRHESFSLTLSFSVCVSIYSKSSSAFNSVFIKIFLLFIHASLLFFSFSHKAGNYVSVPGMVSTMNDRIHCESTNFGGKLLSNCPKWALKTMKCIRYSV